MTASWAAIVLEDCQLLESQFWQGHCALAHGQLRSEHINKIKQRQQGSLCAGAVFCHFPSPVAQEVVGEDHLGGTLAGIVVACFA
jgi:hypothetical protein